MGNYTAPPKILAQKPKGTIVKKIKSDYYVYSHLQYKDEKMGDWTLSNANSKKSFALKTSSRFPVFFCYFLFFVCGFDDFSSLVSYDMVERKGIRSLSVIIEEIVLIESCNE